MASSNKPKYTPKIPTLFPITQAYNGIDTGKGRGHRHEGMASLTQVWKGLWVGSARGITAYHLSSRAITTLVWATPEVQLPPLHERMTVVKVVVRDDPEQDLGPYLPVVAEAFKESREIGEGLAVLCRVGKSRSAALALAALIALPEASLTLKDAYLTIKKARPIIRPNPGFFAQLIRFEKEVRGENSVTMEENPYSKSGQLLPTVYLEELQQTMQGATLTSLVPL